jgi:hypothetical protein
MEGHGRHCKSLELHRRHVNVYRDALNPEVEVSLRAMTTADQVKMLESGSLDIGFLRLPIGGHSAPDAVTVHREPFVSRSPRPIN